MEFPSIGTPGEAMQLLPITVSTDCVRHKNPLHFHDYTQMCYMLSGTLQHTIADREYFQTPGTGTVILPYTRHMIDTRDSEDTPVAVFIRFRDSFLIDRGYRYFSSSSEHARFEEHRIPFFRRFEGTEKERADDIIRKMLSEFSLEKKMSFDRIAALLADYLRIYCTEPVDGDIALVKERAYAVTASIKYIGDHISEKLTIEKLCSVAAMSRKLYTTSFKLITGMTVAQFIHSARMQRASTLIRFSDKPLREIAGLVGMYDKAHLSNAFSDYFGITPSEHRAQAKNNAPLLEEHFSTMRRYKWLDEDDAEEKQSKGD